MSNLPPIRPRQAIGDIRQDNTVGLSATFARWLDAVRVKVDSLNKEAVPTGSIQATLATTAPSDGEWLFCNGQSVSKSSYPALYAIVGDVFGATSLSFSLPDLTDRVLMGAGTIANKATGGNSSITLAENNLPSHSHTITDTGHSHTFTGAPHSHAITDPGHTHTSGEVNANGAGAGAAADGATSGATTSSTTGLVVNSATAGGTNSTEQTGISLANTGSGAAFDITPPALGVKWLIKI